MNSVSIGPATVAVALTTLWRAPEAVRPIDAPAVDDKPDATGWVAAMDHDARLDLLQRVDSQAEAGEPVLVQELSGAWARVVLPWQPSRKDAKGYPGWIPIAHLRAPDADDPATPAARTTGNDVLATGRDLLGSEYVWGGLSDAGIDCSGFAHLTHRKHGLVIPRDASDQAKAGTPVPLDALEPGDLIFFAFDNGAGAVHHVGFYAGEVDGQPTMLHAPRTGRRVEYVDLSDPAYATELCAARRYR